MVVNGVAEVIRFTTKQKWHDNCNIDFIAPKVHPNPVGREGI